MIIQKFFGFVQNFWATVVNLVSQLMVWVTAKVAALWLVVVAGIWLILSRVVKWLFSTFSDWLISALSQADGQAATIGQGISQVEQAARTIADFIGPLGCYIARCINIPVFAQVAGLTVSAILLFAAINAARTVINMVRGAGA